MKKDSLIILGALTAMVLVVFFLVWPEIDAINAIRENLANKNEQIGGLQAFAEKIKRLNEKYSMNPEEFEKFLSVLPKEEEVPALLIQLENLATENGLTMGAVDFKQAESKSASRPATIEDLEMFPGAEGGAALPATSVNTPTYKTIAVSLKLSGGYGAFKNYLAAVEKNVRLMDVTSLSLSGGGEGNYTFTANLNVYYQPK